MCNWLSCARVGAGHVPVVLMSMMVVTLALTYIMAVYRQDVDPYFPYISDAGSKRPESCVFGQLLNIGAFLGIIIVYLRYRLVKELNRGSDMILDRLNLAALIIGCISSFAMTIVGNFQVSAVFVVHLTGAFICLGCGLVYCVLQTAASYRMFPLYNGKSICRIRLAISLVAMTAFLTAVPTGIVAASTHHRYGETWHNEEDVGLMRQMVIIKKTEPGYFLHICSAVSEWILALAYMSFLMTYSKDFEKLRVTVAVEPLVAHLDESPPMAPAPEARSLLSSA